MCKFLVYVLAMTACCRVVQGGPGKRVVYDVVPFTTGVDHVCNYTGGELVLAHPMTLSPSAKYYEYGRVMMAALYAVADHVNEVRCGVLVKGKRYKLKIETYDDVSSKTHVVTIIDRLLAESNVDFFLAGYASSRTRLYSGKLFEANKLLIAGGASSQDVFANKSTVFGTLGKSWRKMPNALTAIKEAGGKSVLSLHEESAVGCNGIDNTLAQLGLEHTLDKEIENEPNMTSMLGHLKEIQDMDNPPDAILFCTYLTGCESYIRALRELNYTPKATILTTCIGNAALTSAVGNDTKYFIGVSDWVEASPFVDSLTGWNGKDFSEIVYKRTHVYPPYQSASTGATLSALVQAIEIADSLVVDDVAAVLRNETFTTFYDQLKFDEDGQRNQGSLGVQISVTGQVEIISPAAAKTMDIVYPMPTWAYRDCFQGFNCSGKGVCQSSGTCLCEEGYKAIKDKCALEPEEDKDQNGLVDALCITLFCINFLVSSSAVLWTFKNRKSDVIKVSQVSFLFVIGIGAIVSSSTILFIVQDDTNDKEGLATTGEYGPANFACTAQLYVYVTGFVLTFAPLFCKLWRTHKIVTSSAKLQRIKVSLTQLVWIGVALLAIDWCLVTIWALNAPMKFIREPVVVDKNGLPISSSGTCHSDGAGPYIASILLFHVLVLSVGVYLCFKTRNINSMMSESKYVSIAMVSSFQVLLLATPIIYIVAAQATPSKFIRSGVIFLNDLSVIMFVFVPKYQASASFSLKDFSITGGRGQSSTSGTGPGTSATVHPTDG